MIAAIEGQDIGGREREMAGVLAAASKASLVEHQTTLGFAPPCHAETI